MRIGLQRTARLLAAGWALAAIVGSWSSTASAGGGEAAVANTVSLEIEISGLGGNGGKLAIKPAHPGCKFKPFEKKIEKGAAGDVKLDPIAVAASTTSADRDCSFEITLTEPGREPRIYRRGVRLSPPAAGATAMPSRTLKCSLPATAVAIKDDARGKTPRR